MAEHFYQINVVGLDRRNEDIFTAWAFEQGAEGVAEKLSFLQPNLVYEPTAIEADFFDVEVYFTSPPPEAFLFELTRQFPEARYELTQQPHKDWLEEWKKGFEPFEFVSPFWIIPSWREVPPLVTHPLHIDPGMAFGTGTHETTQLAGQQILNLLNSRDNQDSCLTLIDIGCGTGVLAIMAKQMGLKHVEAMDIDPECRRVSKENAVRNNTEIVVTDELIADIHSEFDVVVANIIDGVLVQLRSDLMRITRTNGWLILSGILFENDEAFKEQFFKENDHVLLNRIQKGEWVSYMIKKK